MLKRAKDPGFWRSFAIVGPGLITGAADDDPSGISTYSVAGAAYGYATLWIALLTFPLMAAIQLMCARLSIVTGRGLAAAVRMYYPRWVLWGACSILVSSLTSSTSVLTSVVWQRPRNSSPECDH
jgi:NRAMP (natural resistance-associated macrophage protein)-like metal ion transporter